VALVEISAKFLNELGSRLEYDRRWRQWAKVIRSPKEIDLSKQGAYAITSEFVRWGSTVAVPENAYLIAATEAGSNRRRSYIYAIFQATNDGVRYITPEEIKATVNEENIPENYRAKAANSEPYAMALYIVQKSQEVSPSIAAARAALQALTPEELQQVLSEFTQNHERSTKE